MRPSRFSILIFLVLIFLGIAVIVAHAKNEEYRETLQFASGLVGGGAAIYALLLGVRTRRSAAASHFIERYNDHSFADLRQALSNILAGSAPASDLPNVYALLNFFEEMASAVNSKDADERIARGFFFTIVIRFYRAVEGDIKKAQETQPTACEQYETLYRRWNR